MDSIGFTILAAQMTVRWQICGETSTIIDIGGLEINLAKNILAKILERLAKLMSQLALKAVVILKHLNISGILPIHSRYKMTDDTPPKTGSQKIPLSAIDGLKKTIANLAPDPDREIGLQDFVKASEKTIRSALSRGITLKQVIEALALEGHQIKAETLSVYLRALAKAREDASQAATQTEGKGNAKPV